MESKTRAPFTNYEKEFLRELITPHISILESKKTNASFNKEKEEVWCKVAVQFNNCSRCLYATPKQLKKAWNNMKSRARDAKTIIQQRLHTGGGPSIKDMDPSDDAVLSLIPNILPTVKVIQDSDGIGNSTADDDSQFWLHKVNRTHSPQLSQSPTELQPNVPNQGNTKESVKEIPINTQSSPSHPTAKPNLKRSHKATSELSLDKLKLQIVQNDLNNRKERFEIEMAHLKKMHETQQNILLIELEYKKRLLEMAEEEHQIKLNILKNKKY